MPYIKQEQRPFIDLLARLFIGDGLLTGRLNYFIFKVTKEYIKKAGESYANYRDVIGELECAKLEIERRMLSKYEDKKIKQNGDIE